MAGNKHCYVVFVGRNPGNYKSWAECSQPVHLIDLPAVYQKYSSHNEAACAWLGFFYTPGMQIGAEQVDEMVSKAEDHTSEVGGDHQIDELVLTEAEQPSTEIQDTHGKVATSQSMVHFILGAHVCYVLHF